MRILSKTPHGLLPDYTQSLSTLRHHAAGHPNRRKWRGLFLDRAKSVKASFSAGTPSKSLDVELGPHQGVRQMLRQD
jgi:hypothetical protein